MDEAGGGEVARASAAGGVAALPVLLVAADEDRLVERSDALERASADGHVRAPHERDVAVVRAAVEGRDRRRFTPAGAGPSALQTSADRSAEHVVIGSGGGAGEERVEPPVRRRDVVVDEHEQLGRGLLRGSVTGSVRAARRGEREQPSAVAPGDGRGPRVRAVADDDDLGGRRERLGDDRAERHVEIRGPAPRGDDDGGGGMALHGGIVAARGVGGRSPPVLNALRGGDAARAGARTR